VDNTGSEPKHENPIETPNVPQTTTPQTTTPQITTNQRTSQARASATPNPSKPISPQTFITPSHPTSKASAKTTTYTKATDTHKPEKQVDSLAPNPEESTSHYSYDVLTKKPAPVGVDTSKLEVYLSTVEFSKVFGMSKTDFSILPKWKQVSLKKQKGLF